MSKKTRVCMLIDAWTPVYGGGQVHVWELSKRLVENHDCLVDIYTRKLNGPQGEPYDKNESHLGGRLNIYRVGLPMNPYNPLSRLIYILVTPFMVKPCYDIIHAHAYYGAYPGKILRSILRIPLVYTVHGIALKARDEIDEGYISKIKSFFEDITLFRFKYDCEISVDSSINNYKNVNKRIEVIPNGVDTGKFDIVEKKKSEKFRILYVGRFHPQKGLKYLIEAANNVVSKHPEVEFRLVGSGPIEEELKAEVAGRGLTKYFNFRGEVFGEELVMEYKSADLFVLPSIYEGQPLTILEAWAAKLPVVATDVGGNRDFIKDNVNGYLIEPRKPDEIAAAINKAIENPNLSAMGEAGYNLVKEHYTWDRMAEKTFRIYRELITGKRRWKIKF